MRWLYTSNYKSMQCSRERQTTDETRTRMCGSSMTDKNYYYYYYTSLSTTSPSDNATI